PHPASRPPPTSGKHTGERPPRIRVGRSEPVRPVPRLQLVPSRLGSAEARPVTAELFARFPSLLRGLLRAAELGCLAKGQQFLCRAVHPRLSERQSEERQFVSRDSGNGCSLPTPLLETLSHRGGGGSGQFGARR